MRLGAVMAAKGYLLRGSLRPHNVNRACQIVLSLLLEEHLRLASEAYRYQGSWYVGESSNRPRLIKGTEDKTATTGLGNKVHDRQSETYD